MTCRVALDLISQNYLFIYLFIKSNNFQANIGLPIKIKEETSNKQQTTNQH